jgi:hypothetical protein
MKKAAAGCFAITCVLALIVGVLISVGYMRQEKIRDIAPLTLQDLDRLSMNFKKPQTATETPAAAKPSHETANAPQAAPANLPRRLNRCANDEDRRHFFVQGKSRNDRLFCYLATSPIGAVGDTLALIAGQPAGAAWERGLANLLRGRWAEGRMYMEDLFRNSDNPEVRQQAAGYLAWLAEDPEVAAKYMEIASSNGRLFGLSSSALLAKTTGSKELADYYGNQYEKNNRPNKAPAK